MKVLYDHQAFTYQTWGGVSRSFCELIRNRPNYLEYNISIKETGNKHLLNSNLVDDLLPISRDLTTFHSQHSLLGREKIYRFLSNSRLLHTAEYTNQQESIRQIKEGDYDVFHPTFFDTYFLPYIGEKPFVLTVHDLMPELFGWRKADPQIANKPRLLKAAAAVITVSENTKHDLCRLYNISEDKVHVIYHGFPQQPVSFEYKPIIDSPYFLYVGRRGGYKNSTQTIKDYGEFCKRHKNVKFVFTGPDFSVEEVRLLKDCGIYENTIHLFASDDELASLYSHSLAFIFPSLYEGFGMPILEAFSYGCPVLLNNKSCFPEIAHDAALYFCSNGEQSNLVEVMEAIYGKTSEERNSIIKKGYSRLSDFSWTKSAEQLAGIYELIIS